MKEIQTAITMPVAVALKFTVHVAIHKVTQKIWSDILEIIITNLISPPTCVWHIIMHHRFTVNVTNKAVQQIFTGSFVDYYLLYESYAFYDTCSALVG